MVIVFKKEMYYKTNLTELCRYKEIFESTVTQYNQLYTMSETRINEIIQNLATFKKSLITYIENGLTNLDELLESFGYSNPMSVVMDLNDVIKYFKNRNEMLLEIDNVNDLLLEETNKVIFNINKW